MEKEFLKFLTILNKPIHYFLVGSLLVAWNMFVDKEHNHLLLIGLILILLALASVIEYVIRKIKLQIRKNKIIKNEQYKKIKEDERLKNKLDRVINEYNRLKGKEKEIVDYCISNNSRVFQQPALTFEIYTEAIESLIIKRLAGPGSNAYNFIMDEETFMILDTYITKMNNATSRKEKQGKKNAK